MEPHRSREDRIATRSRVVDPAAIPSHHRLPVLLGILIFAVGILGVGIGRAFLPLPHSKPGTGLADQLLSWDGRIYFDIMRRGYGWDPAQGIMLHHYQSIALFPLQPLIDRVLAFLAGGPAAWPILAVSFGFGVASIFAFNSLARRLLAPRAAAWATSLFAFWPASCFYIMGYPTGVISLCIVSALDAHLQRRYWRSALWCGIGTAAAPTVVFVVTALGIDRAITVLRNGPTFRRMTELAAWGVLCISGLLGFMLYQQLRFHDPLAFNQAQAAWGTAPPLPARLFRLVDWHWYVQQPHAGLAEIRHGLSLWHAGSRVRGMEAIEAGIQRWLNTTAMIAVVIGLVLAAVHLRGRAWVVPLAGFIVLAGYAWFIFTTNQNMLTVPRLLFPAVAFFFGLGLGLDRLPRVAGFAVLALFALATMMETAFTAAGYWVT